MKLNLALAEAALELVPKALWRDPSVANDARRREVEPSRILLDRSTHHRAMLRLEDGLKRGRPDLVHVTLLNITCAPLYLDGMVKVFVHCSGDKVLEFDEGTRIPKSYLRFRGLIEQALFERPRTGLVKVRQMGIERLVNDIGADLVVGLSTQGKPTTMEELAADIAAAKNPCVVIGGFAKGHFSRETVRAVGELARVDDRPLDAHVVASRVVYEAEKRLRGTNR